MSVGGRQWEVRPRALSNGGSGSECIVHRGDQSVAVKRKWAVGGVVVAGVTGGSGSEGGPGGGPGRRAWRVGGNGGGGNGGGGRGEWVGRWWRVVW